MIASRGRRRNAPRLDRGKQGPKVYGFDQVFIEPGRPRTIYIWPQAAMSTPIFP